MGLFSRFAKKNTASLAYRRQMAQMISNKRIKYVGERRDGVEEVIGKGGSISIRDDEILVFSSADVLLRAKIADMDASELLSKDGVIITAPDLEHGGAVRTVIVYTEDAYHCPVGHTLCYEDAHSLAAKLAVVEKYGLCGISVCSLAYDIPVFWQLLNQTYKVAKY